MTQKKILLLEGLSCADCGAKIENKVNEIDGVKASLNFVMKTLTVETDEDFSRLMPELKDIVKRYEPAVVISEFKTEKESLVPEKKRILFIVPGLLLFAVALFFKHSEDAKLILYLASYLILGSGVFVKAWKSIFKGYVFNENFLMSVATIGAFVIGEYAEGVAVMLFYQIGELFQDIALNRSRKSISNLMEISPDYGNVLRNGTVQVVQPEDIMIGESIIVKPGEKIPLDGIITDGISNIDKSALTGEFAPEAAEPGDEVFSGSVNMDGLLTIKVTKSFKNSTAEKILEMVENAAARKAPAEKFITRFAKVYTPAVVLIAFFIALVPPLLTLNQNTVFQGSVFITGQSGAFANYKELFSTWFHRALTFLVISCPCALVISIPLGYFGGLGLASGNGVLIKGGNYLDALNHLETAVFDKTGTLTKGKFELVDVVPTGKYSRQMLLQIAAEAESYSNHPIAKSITNAAGEIQNIPEGVKHAEIPGLGVVYHRNGQKIIIGNKKLMEREKVAVPEKDAPGVIVHIAVDDIYEGYLVISDMVKDDSRFTISMLKGMGIKTVMLTGDHSESAYATARLAGIDIVYPELLPEDKVEIFESIKKKSKKKGKTMFAGDGVNDAPVLAMADVGVAMGGLGSDAAIEAADIVLMSDEPSKILTAIKIAKKTKSVVWQNIIFAFAVKAIFLIMGAGGLATMWEAVFADVGVALVAIANAMRLIHFKIKQ
jgi:Cd2+/Zn2+-exporting ATPase